MQSLDKSDTEIERAWAEEAMRRVRACDKGRMKIIPFEEVFGDCAGGTTGTARKTSYC